jgi:hypothetical protein
MGEDGRRMKKKFAALFVTFLLVVPFLLMARTGYAQPTSGAPVYFSIEPVALGSLTDINSSVNGLETPATPSPIGQYFNLTIHLRGGTADNVPAGVGAIEVHLDYSSILAYAQPVNFTNMIGLTGGVLITPIISAIVAGFYDNADNGVSGPPYTGASRYEVAASSTASTAWNAPDGLIAAIVFQITGQPSQQDFYASMTSIFSGVVDGATNTVPFDIVPGTLHIDSPAVQQSYTLTVNTVGSGSVTKSPSAATYSSGTIVTLNATAASSWTFQSWSGDVTGTQNPVNVTMNGNKTVTATFTQVSEANYTLTVSVVGNGTVTKNPSALTYSSGTVVTLTAVAALNWTFQSWAGDVTGSQSPANVTMNGNKTVTATFTQGVQFYNLTVNVVFVSDFSSFVHDGNVSMNPLSATYMSGSVVTLTAVAGANWTFWNWTGDVTGEQNPVNVTMNGNKNVTATFGLLWDLNRDGDVSVADLRALALAWRSYGPPFTPIQSPNWNPHCDIARPWGVIGLTDLVTFAMGYGKLH